MDKTKVLNKYFGYEVFRPGQEVIIDSILTGNSILAVLPTGGGKSLCYQIPALMLNGLCLVVSPLISLMQDQVNTLKSKGVEAELISWQTSPEELELLEEKLFNKKVKLLYCSPEKLSTKSFVSMLLQVELSFVAIDEAHCISEWGHDFRPAYRKISTTINNHFQVPIAAFTGTATGTTISDICKLVGINNNNIFNEGFTRSNLNFTVTNSKNKSADVKRILSNNLTSIVYCSTRYQVDDLVAFLKEGGISCCSYHGGMDSKIRENNQNLFLSGKVKNIVATSAFGMGIDKADVRQIIHIGIPQTIEAYYQEAGRGGRDGKSADCYMFWNYFDAEILANLVTSRFPEANSLMQVANYLADKKVRIELDYGELESKIGIKSSEIEKCLSYFERHLLLKIHNPSQYIKAKLTADREHIEDYYKYLDPVALELNRGILRKIEYSNEYQVLSTGDLPNAIANNSVLLKRLLSKLKVHGLIDYVYSGVNSIEILSNIEFDSKQYKLQKLNAYNKVKAILKMVAFQGDIKKVIANYFDEGDLLPNVADDDLNTVIFAKLLGNFDTIAKKIRTIKSKAKEPKEVKSELKVASIDVVAKNAINWDYKEYLSIGKGKVNKALTLEAYIENGEVNLSSQLRYDSDYHKVKDIVANAPYSTLKRINKLLENPLDFAMLRVMRAQAKYELGIVDLDR